MISPDKMIAGSLGSGVWTMWLVLAVLGEERVPERAASALVAGRIALRPRQFKGSVDLICRNVVESFSFPAFRFPKLACGLKQSQGAKDIGIGEYERVLDRTVDMALSGKMDDAVDGIFRNHLADGLKIADVGFDETIIGTVLDVLEVGKITGIGQLVKVDYPTVRVLVDKKTNHMAADEAGATGYQDRTLIVHIHKFIF